MRLQACLNGARVPGSHPALPQSPETLALDAARVCAAGAEALHLHLWKGGRETLDAGTLGETLRQVRLSVPGVPVGVSTGLWIVSSASERTQVIGDWASLSVQARPEYASVNFSEEGAEEVCQLLLTLGIGIEAGLASVADALRLGRSGLASRCLRWLVEMPAELTIQEAFSKCEQIHAQLDLLANSVLRLTHGTDGNAWALLEEARRRGDWVRTGLEDTLSLPDTSLASGNAALVTAAR